MTMKRIVLTASDYGLAFGVDRSIRALVSAHRMSAVGCLVVSDLWSREFLPLRECVEQAGGRTAVGVTLVLSGAFEPLSANARKIFASRFPSPGYYSRRGRFGLLPDEILGQEIRAQFDRFTELYGEQPEFVTLHDALDRRAGVARLVVDALEDPISQGLAVMFHQPRRWGCRRQARRIAKLGGASNPGSAEMPASLDEDALQKFYWSTLDGEPDNTCVWCRPGNGDDRLRRIESVEAVELREAQLAYLKGHRFLLALTEKERFLF
ncbi:ChbG/HpnK family deacetylase [Breoghania sp. L-A4]|uniref:ChbG/HpnK family deacetylase n=1 Tax=Breoghania sp. L-A4 TaxID=2304600 RepID=UPI000E3593D3|nr:ChbG/HpnK family deacetylase [Breoghania sp. L-A4]AXS39421.1 ChbG/HpnK family deacetylase [Breoghania sp. L-A4]